jgi:hypothetical protein
MKKNVGGLDQKIRYAVGGGLILCGLFKKKVLIVPGLAVIATAILQKCTLYDLIGVSTYEQPSQSDN